MLPLETLMRAAEGAEQEMALVHRDFEVVGLDAWLSSAIARRLDPALGARVAPARWSDAVLSALEGFYGFWGRWFPGEYRRVRREWIVLQARWRGRGLAPPPGLAAVTARLFREGLVDPECVAPRSGRGGFQAALESPFVDVSGVSPAGASNGAGEGPSAAGVDAGMADDRAVEPDEPSAKPPAEPDGSPAPLVHPGDGAGGRLPDGTRVVPDAGGDLAPAAVSGRLDDAMRRGPEAVDKLRAEWAAAEGFWRDWSLSPGERVRER